MFKFVVLELATQNVVGDQGSGEMIVVNPNKVTHMREMAKDTTYVLLDDGTHHIVVGYLAEVAAIMQAAIDGKLEDQFEESDQSDQG